MHPAIRILDCLILITMLASGQHMAVLVAVFITALLLIKAVRYGCYPDFRAIFRLRWLFLSILALYLLFPPLPATGGYDHLAAGLREALMRITALIGIVLLVQTLFALTDRSQVLAGLLWLLKPVTATGVSVERFALRLLLVLEITPRVQVLLRSTSSATCSGNRFTRFADQLAESFRLVHAEMNRSPQGDIEVPRLPAPSALQWFTPLLLSSCLVGIALAGR